MREEAERRGEDYKLSTKKGKRDDAKKKGKRDDDTNVKGKRGAVSDDDDDEKKGNRGNTRKREEKVFLCHLFEVDFYICQLLI